MLQSARVLRALGGAVLLLVANAKAFADRSWAVADSIAVRHVVVDPQGSAPGWWGSGAGQPIVVAPTERYFFFVTYHGDLACDCNRYELKVFSIADIEHALAANVGGVMQPLRTVNLFSRSNEGAISNAYWEQGGASIIYTGVGTENRRGVYRLDVASGKVSLLSNPEHDVALSTLENDRLSYLLPNVVETRITDKLDRYPAVPLDAGDIGALLSVQSRPSQWFSKVCKPDQCEEKVTPLAQGPNLESIKSARQRWPKTGVLRAFQVRVQQSRIQAPSIQAYKGTHSISLMELDPAIQGVTLAPSQTVAWKEGHRTVRGLLTLPSKATPHTPVPLVIQANQCVPELFRPDGAFPTAHATQALAAQGIAVLEIDIPIVDRRPEVERSPRELEGMVTRIDAAVEALAARELIQRERVALLGFSRGGYMTLYTLTHPGRVPLRAAIAADSFMGSFGYYLQSQLYPDNVATSMAAEYESSYGGVFWKNKESWLKHEPLFNVDRVRTPLLLGIHTNEYNKSVLIAYADVVGAFALNHKPLEVLFFPKGEHQLQRPRERLYSLTATVEWMNFWLQGRPPADPERRARWQEMAAHSE